jgi:hypothetical protein
MAKPYISPEEAKEYLKLLEEYDAATKEAVKALRSPPHQKLEGEKLARLIAADAKAGDASKRILEIIGE